MQVKDAEHRLRRKLFSPNAWMLWHLARRTSCISGSWDVRGAHHSSHGSPLHPGVASTRSHLALYAASYRYCGGPLQQFQRGHSSRPDFLQPLSGTSLEDCWNHGIEGNSQGMRALICFHSLRREGWVLGRVPLIPCFLDGNTTSTIPHKYSIVTATNRRMLLSAAVPMVLALPRGRAAIMMSTRSTPGWGTLYGPRFAWAASLWPKLRSSDGGPGLRLPSTDGQLGWLASNLRMVYA